jgi:hypothetical protein
MIRKITIVKVPGIPLHELYRLEDTWNKSEIIWANYNLHVQKVIINEFEDIVIVAPTLSMIEILLLRNRFDELLKDIDSTIFLNHPIQVFTRRTDSKIASTRLWHLPDPRTVRIPLGDLENENN